jgi:hypothetical protein
MKSDLSQNQSEPLEILHSSQFDLRGRVAFPYCIQILEYSSTCTIGVPE